MDKKMTKNEKFIDLAEKRVTWEDRLDEFLADDALYIRSSASKTGMVGPT